MKFTNLHTICGVGLLTMLSACDLTETPYSFTNRNHYYTTQIEIENAVIGAYGVFGSFPNSLGYLDALSIIGDAGTGGQLLTFDQHTFDTENEVITNAYTLCYQAINRANEILAAADNVYFDTEANLNKAKGEALFIRGYFYFYLAAHFGDVPKPLSPTTSPVPIAKSPVAEIIGQAISDFKNAKSLLPATSSIPGKPISAAAAAFLAKAYLYAGEYTQAKLEAKEVIDSGIFGWLPGNYNDIWLQKHEADKEFIYSIQTSTAISNNWLSDYLPDVSDFQCGKGNYRIRFTDDFLNSFEPGDTRYDWYTKEYISSVDNIVKYTAAGKAEKFMTLSGQIGLDSWTKGINFPLMRYSDLVLVYAEAAARDNEPENGLLWLNKVRRRAFNKDTETADGSVDRPATTNTETIIDYIIQERMWEFAGEGNVWADLTRTGKFKLPEYSGNNNTLSDKFRYFPIPYAEIIAGQGLISQNPAWM